MIAVNHLDGAIDDDGFYECNGCNGCGTVEKPDTEYTVHVVYQDTEKQEDLTMSQQIYDAAGVKSNKELIMGKWSVSVAHLAITDINKI